MKNIILAAAVGVIFIAGCKTNTSTSPSDISHTTPNHKGPPFTAGWAGTNLAATFQLDDVTTNYPDGLSTSGSEAAVYLWDSTSTVSVSGGSVTINSTSVSTMDHTSDGGGVYYLLSSGASQTVPILYDGSSLAFNVSGSTPFPALTDTINYINRKMALSAPGLTDTLSVSSGFTITWNHNASSSNTIAIELIDDTSYYQTVTTDNGSFSVTPAMMSGFSTSSQIEVSVTRMNYKYGTDTYGRSYVMADYSTELDYHPLNP